MAFPKRQAPPPDCPKRPNRPWADMRLWYLADQSRTLKATARHFNVPESSLERRARKEGWRDMKLNHDASTMCVARQIAEDEANRIGQELGFSTRELLTKQLAGVRSHMSAIDAKIGDMSQLSAKEVNQLIAAWQRIIGVGRQAFGLDKPAEQSGQHSQTFVNHATIYQGQSVPSIKQHQQDQVIDVPPDDDPPPGPTK